MGSFCALCDQRYDINFDSFWGLTRSRSSSLIGKDIINFHTLFWPARLKYGYRTPTRYKFTVYYYQWREDVEVQGDFHYRSALSRHLSPEYLRYYYEQTLLGVTDMVINLEDFQQKVNADLVGKVVNIASRCAGFINKQFGGHLCALVQTDVFDAVTANRNFRLRAMRLQQGHARNHDFADQANQFMYTVDAHQEDDTKARAHQVCSDGLNLFRLLGVSEARHAWLGRASRAILNIEPLSWRDLESPLCDHTINPFTPCWRALTKAGRPFGCTRREHFVTKARRNTHRCERWNGIYWH